MSRKRLSAADRRTEIMSAARRAYARHGLSASSMQIAAEAKISDALIFRHFGSKAALHREVLRNLILEQNLAYASMGLQGSGAFGILSMLKAYFTVCVNGENDHVERVRILAANLTADGDYARLAYRRAVRLGRSPLESAIAQAKADGHLHNDDVSADNIIMFLEHLGTSVTLASANGGIGAYSGTPEARIDDLVRFCARGIGFSQEAIDEFLASVEL